jgi:hypothetical protein
MDGILAAQQVNVCGDSIRPFTLLAGRRIDFAPRLDRLRYFEKPSAFTSGASDFRHNIFWFRSFHKKRFWN